MPVDLDIPLNNRDVENLSPETIHNPPELNRENFIKVCAILTDVVETRRARLNDIQNRLEQAEDTIIKLENEVESLDDADQLTNNISDLQDHLHKIAKIVSAYRVEASEINL